MAKKHMYRLAYRQQGVVRWTLRVIGWGLRITCGLVAKTVDENGTPSS